MSYLLAAAAHPSGGSTEYVLLAISFCMFLIFLGLPKDYWWAAVGWMISAVLTLLLLCEAIGIVNWIQL